jgi:condensin complex subunit 1
VCFNRLIDENTDFLYRRLNDRDASVKKTCLMTLTFLILAGQVKVKGQLGEMAKCLEDEDRRIADLAKMFFTELSTKDNAIYNGFTDIFSLLSSDRNPLEEDSLRRIVKFLMSFIEKVLFTYDVSSDYNRRSTRNNLRRNWPCAYHVAKPKGSGMMWHMHFRCFPTKMRKFKR